MEVLTDGKLVRETLPTGTVTLLLADLEGSVRLWERDPAAMAEVVQRLDAMIDDCAARHDGARPVEQGEGDSFVLAFARGSDAVACALALQQDIAGAQWPDEVELRFRMGLHTGEVELRDEGNYTGPTINRCARLRNLAHGGQVLLSQPTQDLVADRLPEGASLRDLGSHELRDMARPEHVHQLEHPDLAADFPPLETTGRATHNLPPPVTSFVGRAGLLADIARLLDEARVLTLTGAGGSGKTRLALEAATAALDRNRDGAWWVDLAALNDPHLVAGAIGAAVGIQEAPGHDPVEALVAGLAERRLLVILDNCEHLIEESARLVDALVHRCPEVTVMATSREPLGVEGETSLRVPSMAVPEGPAPSAAEAGEAEAVRLFVERARQVRPNFRLTEDNAAAVTEICRRLDGIPLAIELAAARTRLLTPAEISAALTDRFKILTGGPRTALPRQRTLEASVEWSYDLLSPAERLVLARLSVFAGTFGLDAAEAVGGDGAASGDERAGGDGAVDAREVLDVLSVLVDRSLVQVEESSGETRYRLLETIRVYARQRLAELDDPASVRHRHLDHYIRLAEEGRVGLALDFEGRVHALGREVDNLRAAMDWAIGSGRALAVVEIVDPIFTFWVVRGLYAEVNRRLHEATMEADLAPLDRARGLNAASLLSVMGGEHRAGYEFGQHAVALAGEHDDDAVLALSCIYRAWAGFFSGEGTDAEIRGDTDRALALARTLGDPATLARILMLGGYLHLIGRHAPTGTAMLHEALDVVHEHGVPYLDVAIHTFAGMLGWADGDLTVGRAHGEEALRLAKPIGFHAFVAMAHSTLGLLDALAGDAEAARAHHDEARTLARWAGLWAFEVAALVWEALAEFILGLEDLRATRQALEHASDQASALGNAPSAALARAVTGLAAFADGDLAGARERLEAARAESHDPTYPQINGMATTGLANVSLAEGEVDEAWELAHEALEMAADAGDRLGRATALDAVASVAVVTGGAERAARLVGAADQIRQETGLRRWPTDAERHERAVAAARAELGAEEYERCWAAGLALSEDEAVAYARRGRGERGRPAVGWASLTPAELDVVRLVGEGLSNAEIGERLFVSPNTVKTHLSHAYTKLDVSGRAELAAEVARRDL